MIFTGFGDSGDDAGDGASERMKLHWPRFAQHFGRCWSRAAVDDFDLRKWNVRKFLVVPKKRGGDK